LRAKASRNQQRHDSQAISKTQHGNNDPQTDNKGVRETTINII
jgi:hypothetical protein